MPVVITAGVAVLLAGAAVVTAEQAGCPDPAIYIWTPNGLALIDPCLNPTNLPAPPPPKPRHGDISG
ncbi:MAG: hypothetical protein ACRDRS_06215 [Pseudonocardiaceae bacterium]